MKASLNTIFVIHDIFRDKPVSLPEPITGDKFRYDPIMAIATRRLLYESRADDVFWIHRLKTRKQITGRHLPGEKHGRGIRDDDQGNR